MIQIRLEVKQITFLLKHIFHATQEPKHHHSSNPTILVS